MDYRIKETLAKVEKNLSRPPKISSLAASLNLSVSRFQHLFKQETGINLKKYITKLRLDEARRLLETTHLRVKEIRNQIGATSEAHFLHDFKAKFGKTPMDYRRFYQSGENERQAAAAGGSDKHQTTRINVNLHK